MSVNHTPSGSNSSYHDATSSFAIPPVSENYKHYFKGKYFFENKLRQYFKKVNFVVQNTVGNMVPALWLERMPFFSFSFSLLLSMEREGRGPK